MLKHQDLQEYDIELLNFIKNTPNCTFSNIQCKFLKFSSLKELNFRIELLSTPDLDSSGNPIKNTNLIEIDKPFYINNYLFFDKHCKLTPLGEKYISDFNWKNNKNFKTWFYRHILLQSTTILTSIITSSITFLILYYLKKYFE
ncbi:hypothetical protein [Streptobacillus moniliformis]|uniref:hypothetical protein n=1 Tax=Streptobacillus moniliformis TaxID=34105 RepID=UPI0007E36B6A|nr:hypothetical protein [Streptobacillus moniliformis]